jgi:hypothetical protein
MPIFPKAMPQAKLGPWKCFCFLPFKHCSSISQCILFPAPSWSHVAYVHSCQITEDYGQKWHWCCPGGSVEKQPEGTQPVPSALLGRSGLWGGLFALTSSVAAVVDRQGKMSYKIKENVTMLRMASFPLWFSLIIGNGRMACSSS